MSVCVNSVCRKTSLLMLRCVLQEVKGSAVSKRGYFHSCFFFAVSPTFSSC